MHVYVGLTCKGVLIDKHVCIIVMFNNATIKVIDLPVFTSIK